MQKWFKLDNAAKIYPPTQKNDWASMFRFSATLSDNIDLDILEIAHEHTLKRFPSFACRLRKGLFWYYLERIEGVPPLMEDIYNPMQKLDDRNNRHFMYRILYYRNRIACEFFHALTDGTGGMTFLLTLVNEYIRLKYGVCAPASASKYIFSCSDEPHSEEYEDSFLRYATSSRITRSERTSYQMTGSSVPFNRLLFISGEISAAEVKSAAGSKGVSVGVFLAALLMYAVYVYQQKEANPQKREKYLKISVPLDLRRLFPSKTVRNFSSFLNPGVDSKLGEYTFDEILIQVNHFIGMHKTKKELLARFSENVATERNLFLRIVPLVIKNPLLKLGYLFQGNRYYASTISNLGQIALPDEISAYIERLDFMLGRPDSKRCVCAVVTCNDRMVINFSRTILESEVERVFFTELIKMGTHVKIESNGRA